MNEDDIDDTHDKSVDSDENNNQKLHKYALENIIKLEHDEMSKNDFLTLTLLYLVYHAVTFTFL